MSISLDTTRSSSYDSSLDTKQKRGLLSFFYQRQYFSEAFGTFFTAFVFFKMNRCGLEPCVIGLWGSVRNKQELNLVAVATNTCCIILRCVVLRNTFAHSSFPMYIIMTGYHSISLLASDDVLCSCHDNSSRRCSYYLCMNWSYGSRLWRLNLIRKRDKEILYVCTFV